MTYVKNKNRILQPIDPKRKSKGNGSGAYDTVNDFIFSDDIKVWSVGKSNATRKCKPLF